MSSIVFYCFYSDIDDSVNTASPDKGSSSAQECGVEPMGPAPPAPIDSARVSTRPLLTKGRPRPGNAVWSQWNQRLLSSLAQPQVQRLTEAWTERLVLVPQELLNSHQIHQLHHRLRKNNKCKIGIQYLQYCLLKVFHPPFTIALAFNLYIEQHSSSRKLLLRNFPQRRLK